MELADHAKEKGADAIGFMSPSYFKPGNEEEMVKVIVEVAKNVPDFPVYYYHIPMMNGLDFNVEKMLDLASKECSNIVGVKYTGQDIEKYS